MPDWLFWVEFAAVTVTAVGTVILVVLKILPYLEKRRQKSRPFPVVPLAATETGEIGPTKPLEEPQLLLRKRFTVEPGGHKDFRFRLAKGDRVTGVALEVYGQKFDYIVVDSESYARFYREETFYSVATEGDVASVHVNFIAPSEGTWHFVFDARRKQNDRVIEIELFRETK